MLPGAKIIGLYLSIAGLFLLIPRVATPQAGALFLLISPSAQANGMGQTYGMTSPSSPMGVILNPANLGRFAQGNYAAIGFYPQKVDWMRPLASSLQYNAVVRCAGLNLKQFFPRLPLAFGIANYQVKMDFGHQLLYSEFGEVVSTLSNYDEAKATTIAVAVDYGVRASIGLTFKTITSVLAPIPPQSDPPISANTEARDLALMVHLPLHHLFKIQQKISQKTKPLLPYLEVGFLYSKTNIGDKLSYIAPNQSDPLPRNLTIGINLQTGLLIHLRTGLMPFLTFKWAREVEDLLVSRTGSQPFEYASGFHDIRPWSDLILGQANPNIISKRGYEVGLADFFFFRRGFYEDISGKVIMNTKGTGYNYLRPLQWLLHHKSTNSNPLWKLFFHLSLERHTAQYTLAPGHPLDNTKFETVNIGLRNVSFD